MKKNMTGRTILTTVALSLATCTLAFAAIQGPKDYYEKVYTSNKYTAGDTIDAGKYVLYNTSDTSLANYSLKSSSKFLRSDTFSYNAIVYLEDGDVINISKAYMVPYEEARIQPVESCMVIVGQQVPAGTYSAEYLRGTNGKGTVSIMKTIDMHRDKSEIDEQTHSISNGSSKTLVLNDGDVLKLEGVRLVD